MLAFVRQREGAEEAWSKEDGSSNGSPRQAGCKDDATIMQGGCLGAMNMQGCKADANPRTSSMQGACNVARNLPGIHNYVRMMQVQGLRRFKGEARTQGWCRDASRSDGSKYAQKRQMCKEDIEGEKEETEAEITR